MPAILYVDSNKNVREFWRKEFERRGLRASLASGEAEALLALAQGFPDILILDLRSSDAGELAMAARALQNGHDTAVVFYTVDSAEASGLSTRFQDWDTTEWVEKDGDPAKLMRAVYRILARREARRVPGVWGRPAPGLLP